MRDSFVFYKSFWEAIKELDGEDAKKLLEIIVEYATTGEQVECTGAVKGMFSLIKPQIDANNKRYENGCKGGKKTKSEPNANQNETKSEPNANQSETKSKPNTNQELTTPTPNDNVNDNDNVNVGSNEPNSAREYFPDNAELDEAFAAYINKRDKITAREIIQAQQKLNLLSGGDPKKALAIIDQSLANGWKGLFELEADKKPPATKQANFTERQTDEDTLNRELFGRRTG